MKPDFANAGEHAAWCRDRALANIQVWPLRTVVPGIIVDLRKGPLQLTRNALQKLQREGSAMAGLNDTEGLEALINETFPVALNLP